MTDADRYTATGCPRNGQLCHRCNGYHHPPPGPRFVTALTWPTDEDDDADEWQV
jgi:hypothetical protein